MPARESQLRDTHGIDASMHQYTLHSHDRLSHPRTEATSAPEAYCQRLSLRWMCHFPLQPSS